MHSHMKLFAKSVQLPLLLQGLGSQSLMLIAQVSPVYPGMQSQVKYHFRPLQVPLYSQGLEAHSIISTSHITQYIQLYKYS